MAHNREWILADLNDLSLQEKRGQRRTWLAVPTAEGGTGHLGYEPSGEVGEGG